jgi:internalin A
MDEVELQELIIGASRMTSPKLALSGEHLTVLPPEIFRLPHLQSLELSGNRLTALPPEIGRLTNLRSLQLGGNQLTTLPPEITQLTCLQSLHLGGNRLAALPPEIAQLPRLQSLDLSGNPLTPLPPEIGQLTNLRSLSLNGLQLTTLPLEIGQLISLQSLQLGSNRLATLPPTIAQLTSLQSLNLSSNQLTTFLPQIAHLTSLRRLILSGNQLPTLPPEIGQLANLQSLDLRYNRLTALPREIGQLTSLQSLDLLSNQLTALPPGIAQLPSLQSLDLRHNQLSTLLPEIGQLTTLKKLNLRHNQLNALPPEIGRLVNLNTLLLDHNQLTVLPPEIAHLTSLRYFDFNRNPWAEPFDKLTERTRTELFAYLRSLLDGIPQYEAKVLLVGEGAVGKSSLLRALRGEKFVKDLPTTHGIEIKQVAEPHPDAAIRDNLTLNFWDFGGQEVYRITHQFFFSRHAVYLLVWKPREGREENALEEWLERIHLRVGNDARVIIVATHFKERHPELDYPALRAKYPGLLAGNLAVDSSDGTGIPELRRLIGRVVAAMAHVGTPFNRRWLEARDELKALDATHVTYDQFARVCANHGMTPTDASALIGMLHTLGHIVFYDSDVLRDFVVLKPEWLTRAISYVLEDRQTHTSHGILDHRRLSDIWCEHGDLAKESYPPRYFPYFLRLMEQYDVSARLEGYDASLIPQLVPFERPEIAWRAEGGVLSLACEMEQNPPGLIAWLTARNHRWSTGTHWRGGVFLRHEDGHEALLDFTSRLKRRLALTVRGDYPAHFMSLLRDGLEQLIRERWPYLDYQLAVPCPTSRGGSPCIGQFSLQTLYRAKSRRLPTMLCHECLEEIDVGQLLEGYVTPIEPLSTQLAEMEAKLMAALQEAHIERQSILAQAAEMTRRVLRAMLDEAREGPRLFLISPSDPARRLDPRNLLQEELRLTLWCEHPGHEHELGEEGQYIIRTPRKWVARIAPYALLAVKVLRIAAPLSVGIVGVAEDAIKDQLEPSFKLMEQLSKSAGEIRQDIGDATDHVDHFGYRSLTRTEGEGLRAFHDLLAEVGWKPGAANLRRVTDKKTGDVLWVCPVHYSEYDPGLPEIPAQI